jgi:hypothetical protein
MGLMDNNIYIPLIYGYCPMEGIKEESLAGLRFFNFSPSQLQKKDMI